MAQQSRYIMCSMKFLQISKKQKKHWQHFLITKFPIEPLKRTKAIDAIVWLIIIMDYLAIILILSLILLKPAFQIEQIHFNIPIYIKIGIMLSYIILQYRFLLLINKILTLSLIVIKCQYLEADQWKTMLSLASCIVLELICCGIKTIVHEQRIVHFDSKLTKIYGYMKDNATIILLYFLIIKNIEETWMKVDQQVNFYTICCLLLLYIMCIFLCDFYEKYHEVMIKRFLIGFDIWSFMVLAMFYQSQVSNSKDESHSYIQFYLMATILLMLIVICIIIAPKRYQYIFTCFKYQKKSEEWQLNYRIEIDQLIRSDQDETMNKFYYKHLSECTDPECFLKYFNKTRKDKTQFTFKDALRIMSNEQLEKLSYKNQKIKFYFIMKQWHAPDRIFKFFKTDSFYHRRQYYRMFNSFIKQQKNSEQLESDLIINTSFQQRNEDEIKKMLRTSQNLWGSVMKNKINCKSLLDLSTQYMLNSKKLKEMLQNAKILDRKVEVIGEKMLNTLYQQKDGLIQERKTVIRDYFACQKQTYPAFLICGEKQNFLKIINVNTAAMRASGFTKKELFSITIESLWHEEFRDTHTKMVNSRLKENIFHRNKVVKTPAFITNKFGYLVYAFGLVIYMNEIDGKKWCVVLEPYRVGEPIIVTNRQGKILGVNEHVIKLGINKEIIGTHFKKQIFQSVTSSEDKKETSINNTHFLEEMEVSFTNNHDYQISLKFLETLSLIGIPFFKAFTIVKSHRTSTHKTFSSRVENNTNPEDQKILKTIKPPNKDLLSFKFNIDTMTYSMVKGTLEKKSKKKDQRIALTPIKKPHDFNDEDIETMRCWKNELQFVQNLPKPIQQADPLPLSFKLDLTGLPPVITEQALIQKIEYFSTKTPSNLKYLRIIFIILIILVLGFGLTLLLFSNAKISYIQNHMSVNKLVGDCFINLMYTGIFPMNQQVFPEVNWEPINNKKIKEIEGLLQKLNEEYPEFYSSSEQDTQSIRQIQIDYQISIKKFIQDPTPQNILELYNNLIDTLSPKWKSHIQINGKQLSQNIQLDIQTLLFITAGLLTALLVMGLIFKKWWLVILQNQKQVLRIIAKIPDTQIQHRYIATRRFQDYITLNLHLEQIDFQHKISQVSYQDNVYPKKLAKISIKSDSLFLLVLALLFLLIFCSLGCFCFEKFMSSGQILHTILTKQYTSISSFYVAWITINNFEYSKQTILSGLQQINKEKQILIQNFFNRNSQSSNFKSLYLAYSFNQTGCSLDQYASYGPQFKQIGQTCVYGEKYMEAYLMNQLQKMLQYQQIQMKQYLATMKESLSTLFLGYLHEKHKGMVEIIIEEAERQSLQMWMQLGIVSTSLVICLVLVIVGYKGLAEHIMKIQELQKVVFTFQYDILKQIPNFRHFIYRKFQQDQRTISK